MLWSELTHPAGFVVDLVAGTRRTEEAKEPEIAPLRHQVRLLRRRLPRPPRLSRWEKVPIAVLAARLHRPTARPQARLTRALPLVQSAAVLKRHRELVRRKWTFRRRHRRGRPPIAAEVEALPLRLAEENPGWGCGRIHGELAKPGHPRGRSTVRDVRKRRHIPPAPLRGQRGSSRRQFLARHREAVPARDFFAVETLSPKTVYVLLFPEIGTRRAHLAGCTSHPTAARVTRQARQLAWAGQDAGAAPRFPIYDRDAKFPPSFDAVFAAEGIAAVRTPYRAPDANAYAERRVRPARAERLDQLRVAGETHLRRILTEYVACYNHARPHRGLAQRCPVALPVRAREGPVRRRDRLGGPLHDDSREAA